MTPGRRAAGAAGAGGDDRQAALGEAVAAIAREIDGGCDLVAAGLRERRIVSTTPHAVLTCLGAGFERLLKAVVCLEERRRTDRFPDRSIFPAGHRGHDLTRLARRLGTAAAGACLRRRAALMLREHRRAAQGLADLLTWGALVAEGVVVNKDGSSL